MPSGIFDLYKDLDQIDTEEITKWISPAYGWKGPTPDSIFLENYTANRSLYPRSVSMTKEDMVIEMAILREALKKDKSYINTALKKIFIPQVLPERFDNLPSLVWAFIDAYLYDLGDEALGVWTVILKSDDKDESVGSVIVPQLGQSASLAVEVEGKKATVKSGSLVAIPCLKSKCTISFKSTEGKLLGQQSGGVEIHGGKAGIILDGRIA